jgi:hypothetical protein
MPRTVPDARALVGVDRTSVSTVEAAGLTEFDIETRLAYAQQSELVTANLTGATSACPALVVRSAAPGTSPLLNAA